MDFSSEEEEKEAQLTDCREWLLRVPVPTNNGGDMIANKKEIIPMGLMGLFEIPISPINTLLILLHEEVLGRRGMVYVAAKAARRACTKTELSHSDSLRALDLCDRYVEGEEIPKEELARAANVADVAALSACDATWGAAWATCKAVRAANAASSLSPVRTDAWAAVEAAAVRATSNEEGEREEERKSQLADCREWLLKGNT